MTPPAGRADPALWLLAAAQTLVYAGAYYIFAGLLPHWEADLGWSKTLLTGAFTVALIAEAVAAPLAGRAIDRGHGAAALGIGMAVAGLAVATLALARAPAAFYAAWIAIGLASAFCTYDACFSVVTRTKGAEARRAITLITLVAGFAGTLSFPAAHALAEGQGWRVAVLVAGAVVALIAAPLVFAGARRLTPGPPAPPARTRPGHARPGRSFALLALALAALATVHAGLIAHLLPLLAERGFAPGEAVLAAAMIGPMQVAGRVLMMAIEARVANRAIAAACFAGVLAAVAALIAASEAPPMLALFVALQGMSNGVMSIMKPVVIRDILGERDFGRTVGRLARPALLATAGAPWAAALAWQAGGGYGAVLAGALAISGVGLAAFLAASRDAEPRVA